MLLANLDDKEKSDKWMKFIIEFVKQRLHQKWATKESHWVLHLYGIVPNLSKKA